MTLKDIVAQIDAEIAKLQQARSLLVASGASVASPKTSKAKSKPTKKKRTLSPEARARIADAQRKRWAAQRKAAK
jgi:hypothetical protein